MSAAHNYNSLLLTDEQFNILMKPNVTLKSGEKTLYIEIEDEDMKESWAGIFKDLPFPSNAELEVIFSNYFADLKARRDADIKKEFREATPPEVL